MTSVFLQVRLDSSRLPRKALALLGGRTVTERCLEALSKVACDRFVLVTEPESASGLEPLAAAAGWDLFVGSKENVLDRFVQAARATQTQLIVRATGDNPLVSARLANLLVRRQAETQADYSALVGAPVGTGVEVVTASALERAWASSPDAYDREHVSPHLYRHPDRFVVDRSPVPPECHAPDGRVTLDTPEDLDYVRALWDTLYAGNPLEVEDLIPWLNHHPR